mmetsp:Transcript_44429/g.107034  ORF Transcript_44429/g.107034 Transcript_44429/m.107034 type:complete len:88 (+) Transcript_44429:151-414(+)
MTMSQLTTHIIILVSICCIYSLINDLNMPYWPNHTSMKRANKRQPMDILAVTEADSSSSSGFTPEGVMPLPPPPLLLPPPITVNVVS